MWLVDGEWNDVYFGFLLCWWLLMQTSVGLGRLSVGVCVLGPVEVVSPGEAVRATRLQRALLAVLVAHHGQTVSTDRLVDALWAQPPSSARNRVQSVVSALRKLVAADRALSGLVVTDASGYALRLDHSQLDVACFERLASDGRRCARTGNFIAALKLLHAALALWRGAAFEGIDSPYVMSEAARLEELRQVAIEDMVEARLAVGRPAELVAELAALVSTAPYRVRLRGQLMIALHRCGRQAEALEVYRAGAQFLADEHGLDPGGELQRLRDAILLDQPVGPGADRPTGPGADWPTGPGADWPMGSSDDFAGLAGGWLSRASVPGAPCLLPGDIGDFAGREAQLAAVTGLLLDRADAAVALISGCAGVGKTALAVRAGHRLRASFTDGQLFIDLGGAGRPVAAEEALERFLRALGVADAAIPERVDERAEMYRDRLAHRRLLVVLDNASSAAQVRPLLPGEPLCGVLVTSRRPLSGLPGAALVELDPLPPDQAVDLLAHMVDASRVAAEPHAAQALVQLCGGLPLAIRIAGGRLASRPSRPLSWLANRLADPRRRLDELALDDLSVRTSLAGSYRGLSTTAQRLFRALGLLDTATFAPWLAAALLDVSIDVAETLLESLVDERLVDVIDAAAARPRYRLHELVRLYAHECATDQDCAPDRRAAISRAATESLRPVALAISTQLGGPISPVHSKAIHDAAPSPMHAITADPIDWRDTDCPPSPQ